MTSDQLETAFTLYWAKKMKRGLASKLSTLELMTLRTAFQWIDRNYDLTPKCEHCTPERKCPDHGAALTSNDD